MECPAQQAEYEIYVKPTCVMHDKYVEVKSHNETHTFRLLLSKCEAIEFARAIVHIINTMDDYDCEDTTSYFPQ